MNGNGKFLADNDLDNEDLAQAAERFGRELELPGPAPIPATRRMLADPEFARALHALRRMPELRDQMLAAPEEVRIRSSDKARDVPPAPPQRPSSQTLMAKAAKSVLKWGMEGLKPAQPWIIERRLAACAKCEFREAAPETLIYRGAKFVAGKDSKICSRCMCLINTKAAISTERCPEKDPQDPAMSRWGEPWVAEPRAEWIWGK